MKKYLLLCFAFFIFFIVHSTYSQSWKKVNGVYPYINQIFTPNANTVSVASDEIYVDLEETAPQFFPYQGTGFKTSRDNGATFSDSSLQGFQILDITSSSAFPDLWYASIAALNRGGIVVSTNAGRSWDSLQSLPIKMYGTDMFFRIAASPVKAGKAFAAVLNSSQGVISTLDTFNNSFSPQISFSAQTRDIKISKKNPSLIFAAIDDLYGGGVMRSTDEGETWTKHTQGIKNLRIHTVQPSSSDENIVFAGADTVTYDRVSIGRGIFISYDKGESWAPAYYYGIQGIQCFDIEEHPLDPNYLIAAGGRKGIFVSRNKGISWWSVNDGIPKDSSVRVVAIPPVPVQNGFIAYAGVFGDGLYKSTYITNSEEQISTADNIKVFPMPASGKLNLMVNLKEASLVNIALVDNIGNTVLNLNGLTLYQGSNELEIPVSNFASGSYQIIIDSDKTRLSKRVIIQ